MKSWQRYASMGLFLTFLPAGSPVSAEQGHDHEKDESPSPRVDTVTLTPEALASVKLVVETVSRGKIANQLVLTGAVTADADRLAHLHPKVEGLARSVRKGLGDRVKAGELLAEIDAVDLGTAKLEYLQALNNRDISRVECDRALLVRDNTQKMLKVLRSGVAPLEAERRLEGLQIGKDRSRLLGAFSTLRLAEATYAREKALYEKKVSPEKDFLEAKKAFETARAEYRGTFEEISYTCDLELFKFEKTRRTAEVALAGALRRLFILGVTAEEIATLDKTPGDTLSIYSLKAPFAGAVIEKHMTLGERVSPETSLFTIADLSFVWVLADIYEKDLSRVRTKEPAAVELVAYPGQTWAGRLTYISNTLDEKTRTARCRVVLSNPDGLLKPGMFARVKIAVGSRAGVLTVPLAALQEIEGKTAVFVKEGEKFLVRPVTLGEKDAAVAEVLSGLKEGEQVVADGSFVLKSELQKSEMGEGGHAH